MRTTSRVSLTVLVAAILISCLRGDLDARGREGAELVVTVKNGSLFEGELVAVKTDSLLLIDHMSGRDASIALADISVIRVVRKSRAVTGLLVGFGAGAAGGAVWGAHASDEDMGALGAFIGGAFFGTIAGLVGLAAGFGAGIDSVVHFADLPDAEKNAFLLKLDRHAREPGVYVLKTAGTIEKKEAAPLAPAARGWSRFRISWMPAYTGQFEGEAVETGVVPFRFTETLPPGEAGPYDSRYYWATHLSQDLLAGQFSLGYQWTRRLGAEIELRTSTYTVDHLGDLLFTSTIDGLTYDAVFGFEEITRSVSVLAGLTFQALAPTDLQPHAVELAAAAGPAWLSTTVPPSYSFYEDPQQVDRRLTLTARARVSYEYHFGRTLSMGVYGEYRWLEADIPAFGATEDMIFNDVNDPYGTYFSRVTEVTLPARRLEMGGFALGLRFGFGF